MCRLPSLSSRSRTLFPDPWISKSLSAFGPSPPIRNLGVFSRQSNVMPARGSAGFSAMMPGSAPGSNRLRTVSAFCSAVVATVFALTDRRVQLCSRLCDRRVQLCSRLFQIAVFNSVRDCAIAVFDSVCACSIASLSAVFVCASSARNSVSCLTKLSLSSPILLLRSTICVARSVWPWFAVARSGGHGLLSPDLCGRGLLQGLVVG